jgi:hypothetical protein
MPIKVPQIAPSTEVGGVPGAAFLDPARYGALATFGTRTAAYQLGGVAREVEQLAGEQLERGRRAAEQLRRQNIAAEADIKVEEYRRLAAEQLDLIRDDATIRPEDLATRVRERGMQIRQGLTKRLDYPESLGLIERRITHLQTNDEIQARAEGRQRSHAELIAKTDLLLNTDERDAVFGATPEIRAAGKAQGVARIAELGTTGVLPGAAASARIEAFGQQVQRGEILRDARSPDPQVRAQTVQALTEGQFPFLPPAEQLQMAQTIQAEDARREQKRTDELEKAERAKYQALMSDLYLRAEEGTLTIPEFNQAVRDNRIRREDQAAINAVLTRDPTEKERPSTQEVLHQVIFAAGSSNPTISEQQIKALHASWLAGGEGLSTKDAAAALNRVRETNEGNVRFARSMALQARSVMLQEHSQAEQNLRAGLNVPADLDKVDKTQRKVMSDAFLEFQSRSQGSGGRLPPLQAAQQVIDKYRPMLGQAANMSVQQQGQAVRFPSLPALEEARRRGDITEGEYNLERSKLNRLRKSLEDQKRFLEPQTVPGEGWGFTGFEGLRGFTERNRPGPPARRPITRP